MNSSFNKFEPVDLSLATSTWDEAERSALIDVIESGNFTMGEKVRTFEKAFAAFVGSAHAVMVNSGSSANLLAIAALVLSDRYDLTAGDEIIVPAVSWSTTYYPPSQYGLILKFVDIDPGTLNLDITQLEKSISPKTKAILGVNLLGNPLDLAALMEICSKHNLILVEDNCESLGAELEGRQAGTFGVAGTFSTFFSHHISTMEGGMVVTDDAHLYEMMLSLRAHGWTRDLPAKNTIHNKEGDAFLDSFRFVLPGYNLRPLELEGAVGIHQLKKTPAILEGRRINGAHFAETMLQFSDYFSIQQETGKSSWFGFAIVLREDWISRSKLVDLMTTWGVQTRPIVTGNFTRNPVTRHLNHAPVGPLPNADLVDSHGLFFGNHHFDVRKKIDKLARNFSSLTG